LPLTAVRVRTLTAPGLYGDGGNLWLKVTGPNRRSWVFRYMIAGRARSMGLGSADDVPLAVARDKAEAARRLLRSGIDPLTARETARAAAMIAASRSVTFSEVADRYIAAQQAGWRNPKHPPTWRSSLAADVLPTIGALPIDAIDTDLVLRVLEPIWPTKPDTARRVRGRIEMILSYAIARGWRDGPNPAVWRGHLQTMLPSTRKVRAVKHHAALDWREAPAFMVELRRHGGIGHKLLEFIILTAARSGEARRATWDEIDLDAAVWTVPAAHMKAGKEHRVPLSEPALAVLQSVAALRTENGQLFPGQSLLRLLGVMALPRALRSTGRNDLTVHGFRSTFRDWCADTGKPGDIAEAALAHTVGSEVERAYRRGDLFAQRVALMNDWAAYLARGPAEVVPLRWSGSGA
jgi:integrase